jgi:RNA polymerase sigma-70 factor (ECF subfamily)
MIAPYGNGYPPTVQPDPAPASITELYDRFRRPAFSLARRILGDDVLAEDVVQDVFLSVWLTNAPFDSSRGSFAGWLMATVHHKAVDAVRREQSQRNRQNRALDDALTMPAAPVVDVEDAVCDRAVAERVRTALAALPVVQRRALALAYYSGFTQREIAALTGTPLGTVKTRMRAGMGQLRNALHEVAGNALGGPALADA